MAIKYYGKETLIVTGSSFSEYPSGLARADVTYVCRTTKASLFTASLGAQKKLPNFSKYTSHFAATREDRSDGFTYFSATGYAGNAGVSSAVLGGIVSNLSLPMQTIVYSTGGQSVNDSSVPVTIISDIVTGSYTIATSASNTTKISASPPSTLSYRIIGVPSFVSQATKTTSTGAGLAKNKWYTLTDLNTYVGGKVDIINLDRQNYGTIDEVTVTWGYIFNFTNPLQFFRYI